MAKVKFENPTGNEFMARFPGSIVHIPAYAYGDKAHIAELPELDVVASWISDLTTRHRAVKATLLPTETPKVPDNDIMPPDGKSDDAPGPGPVIDPGQSEPDANEQKNGDIDPFEIFKASVVSAVEGGGGWWTVIVDGVESPIKVRGCENENEAILEAYQKHVEG